MWSNPAVLSGLGGLLALVGGGFAWLFRQVTARNAATKQHSRDVVRLNIVMTRYLYEVLMWAASRGLDLPVMPPLLRRIFEQDDPPAPPEDRKAVTPDAGES